MNEPVNITFLETGSTLDEAADTRPTMIKVDHVSMVFNMASQKLNNLKEYAIAIARRELMFKEFRALNDVSFTVKKGDVFGIMGTNGSGKSTMLKIIAGVLEPTEGTVEIQGNIAPLIELGAGFDHELTARENIYLNGALLGYPKKFIDKHFEEIVDFAEIRDFLDMPLKNYSSGMVARIAFAIATVMVPEILIVDEVLSVGDFMFQQKCERRIQTLIKEHDVTVLIVSHDNNQIERLCNKAIWIEKGHTRALGTARDVCRLYSTLGGHAGSSENEQRVYEMLIDPIAPDASRINTIGGEDRYGTAAKLFDLDSERLSDVAVVCQGLNPPVCMIANALAGALRAPVLLTKPETVPDIAATVLKKYKPSQLYIVGSKLLSEKVLTDLESVSNCPQVRLESADPAALSVAAYHEALAAGAKWGRTAFITYPECIGDITSFMPYIYAQKCPLFFNSGDALIDDDIIAALTSGAFDRLIVMGSTIAFPEDYMAQFVDVGLEIVRICGRDPYDANNIINAWLSENTSATFQELIISSRYSPEDAFAIGPYAGTRNAAIILEDPKDLDSVANAFAFIGNCPGRLEKLTFLGNQMRFNEQDKQLLEKALEKRLQLLPAISM